MGERTFIDLFAGAGGFGLGFQLGGFRPILSVEKDKWACDTLIRNNAHCIINKDITSIDTPAKIKRLCGMGKPSVIIGGPPCQGFSVAASNRVKNKESKNNLFRNYLRWVKVLAPEVFIIENVPGILTQKVTGKRVLDEINRISRDMGFYLSIWKLNALNYGVPQSRERIFIVGAKSERFISPPKPTHAIVGDSNFLKYTKILPAVSVGEAIFDLPAIKAREGIEVMEYSKFNEYSKFQKWARKGSKFIYNHVAMKHTDRIVKRYESILKGEKKMPEELKVRKRNGGGQISNVKFNQNYRCLHPDRVSYTIPASFYSSFIHPNIPRNITAREAARLQSFPDKYIFEGKRTIVSNSLLKKLGKEDEINLSQYNQIGNAVPPLLAKAVAGRIKKYLKSQKDNS